MYYFIRVKIHLIISSFSVLCKSDFVIGNEEYFLPDVYWNTFELINSFTISWRSYQTFLVYSHFCEI